VPRFDKDNGEKTPIVANQQNPWRKSAPSRGPRASIDRDTCPPGLRPEVWNLALVFEQFALARDIKLPQGRFLIYDILLHRITASKIEQATSDQLLDSRGGVRRWDELVEYAIREYWTPDFFGTDYDEYALEDFCHPMMFKAMCQKIRKHAMSQRIAAQSESRAPLTKPAMDMSKRARRTK
jgi:hypothetical protein